MSDIYTKLASGHVMKWNGTDWVNVTQTVENLEDVTISSIATGEILKWNGSAWVNNTLAEAGITTLIGSSISGATVTNTTTETTVLSATTASGEFEANDVIHFHMLILGVDGSSGGNLTLRCKAGSTAILTDVFNPPDASCIGELDIYVHANDSTSAQETHSLYHVQTLGSTNTNDQMEMATEAATVDVSGAITWTVTAQWAAADPSATFDTANGVATLLKENP